MQGIIKVLKNGYGFVTPDEGGDDLFFHVSGLAEGVEFNDLREGDAVTFETAASDRPGKGAKAVNVAKATGATEA